MCFRKRWEGFSPSVHLESASKRQAICYWIGNQWQSCILQHVCNTCSHTCETAQQQRMSCHESNNLKNSFQSKWSKETFEHKTSKCKNSYTGDKWYEYGICENTNVLGNNKFILWSYHICNSFNKTKILELKEDKKILECKITELKGKVEAVEKEISEVTEVIKVAKECIF